MNETILIDTGGWSALLDPRDQHYGEFAGYAEVVEASPLIVPWPIMYETLGTRLARRGPLVARFNLLIARPGVTLVDDGPYRDDAFSLAVEYSNRPGRGRDLSMVDMLCRLLIEDRPVKIDYLMTPNRKEFEDVRYANGAKFLP